MSLLIDALKQAEAARAQSQESESADAASGITLTPIDPPKTPSPAAPATPATPPRENVSAASRTQRPARAPDAAPNHAARELFEVKQPPPNRLPLILAGGALGLFLLGGAYVWWAMQPRSGLMSPTFQSDASQGNINATLPAQALETQIPREQLAASNAEPQPVVPTEAMTARPAATPNANATNSRERQTLFRPTRQSERTAAPSADLLAAGESRSIRSGTTQQNDGNGIQAAYAAFLAGDHALARQRYEEVLRHDPRSVDAMNALGLIAWRSGQPNVAERMFRAALNADPKDATAASQLALLYAEGDPASAEARLRTLISSQPNAGAAHYALGSLMSRQGRWNEAQQSLFQAYTLDSDNPDVLFNLAVSLEHIGQASVARQFYERALHAAGRRPAGFDKGVAQNRMLTLGNR